ncbi:hypothetical protein [Fulvimarina sp. MAC8]|uniref:hypothetical protein n=1 Tax=Fulvimarina sp. MAC8 TaxID=3162874 RepID=UPI0032EB7700
MSDKLLLSSIAGFAAMAGLLSLASASLADTKPDTASLEVGRYVMIAREYDSETDSFSVGPPPGEREACFQVEGLTAEGVKLRHISGRFKPWWSDETYAPGTYHDTWFSSEAYRENHPNADSLTELRFSLKNVDSCPR